MILQWSPVLPNSSLKNKEGMRVWKNLAVTGKLGITCSVCHAPSHNVMQCSDWSDGRCRRHEERTDGAQSEEEEDGVEEIRWEGQPSPVKTQLSYWQIIYHQSGILYYSQISWKFAFIAV